MEKYDLMSGKAQSFINPAEINRTLAYAKKYGNDASMVRFILDKAREKKGLTHTEAAVLLLNEDPKVAVPEQLLRQRLYLLPLSLPK